MEIAAILLTLGVFILVGLYLYAPLLERQKGLATAEEHELSSLLAERDRVVNSLQELDFDFKLGKIPEGDYPTQRAALLQKGADILKNIDTLSAALSPAGGKKRGNGQDTEERLEKAVAARRADGAAGQSILSDDDIESLISARRKGRRNKSAGFCPKCGKPVMSSDKFCPSCGKSLG